MTDTVPPTDPLLAEATEIVQELIRQGLTRTEISRLCDLPGRIPTIGGLQDGTLKAMKPGILDALKVGYQRFDNGDLSWRKVRNTRRAEEAVKPPSDARPMPLTRIEGSRLWDRLAQRVKEAA
jgi:hypothetical protein